MIETNIIINYNIINYIGVLAVLVYIGDKYSRYDFNHYANIE